MEVVKIGKVSGTKVHVKIEFTEELLGSSPSDPEIYSRFIASKAPDAGTVEDEIEALGADAVEERSMTVFPRTPEGAPAMWDYQWRGYFKESCSMLNRVPGTESKKIKAFRKENDGLIFVEPRLIELKLPEGASVGDCQRPLRASGPTGERVALAHSESVPAGTTCEFDVIMLKDGYVPALEEWLDYGYLHGTGQWRNSGKGRFVYEIS